MNYFIVNVPYKTYYQFKKYPHLKVTKCKKVINTKTGNLLRHNDRGYFIVDSYIKKQDIDSYLEPIPDRIINQLNQIL